MVLGLHSKWGLVLRAVVLVVLQVVDLLVDPRVDFLRDLGVVGVLLVLVVLLGEEVLLAVLEEVLLGEV